MTAYGHSVTEAPEKFLYDIVLLRKGLLTGVLRKIDMRGYNCGGLSRRSA